MRIYFMTFNTAHSPSSSTVQTAMYGIVLEAKCDSQAGGLKTTAK